MKVKSYTVRVFQGTAVTINNYNDPRSLVRTTFGANASDGHGETVISTVSFVPNTNYVFAFRAISNAGGSPWIKIDYTFAPKRNLRGARQ
jgi:hypothetical protein